MTKLHTADLIERWNTLIAPDVFENATREDRPLTVYLGGQSGAGKTQCINRLQLLYAEDCHSLVYVNPDALRQYHPDFTELMEERAQDMPKRTGHAASEWTKYAVEQANRDGYSVIVEGTWNNPDKIKSQMKTAKDNGRTVHMAAMAVPKELSRLAILERYYNDKSKNLPARWVAPAVHDKFVKELPDHVYKLVESDLPDRFLLVERGGFTKYYEHDDGYQFVSDWELRANRHLEREEAQLINDHAKALQESILEIDPDNEDALRTVQQLIDTSKQYLADPPKYPKDNGEQPRKPNGEYDFKD